MIKNDKGLLLVISGPSGTGKGTVCKRLLEKNKDIFLSVSATTRKPREGEIDGVSYHFYDEDKFRNLIAKNQFIEWAAFCDNYYGTPKAPVVENIENGRDVMLEIEIEGAMKVRAKHPEGVYIFLFPPSIEALEERLKGRGTETDEVIAKRLARAKEEFKMCTKYNYYVVNDDLEKAVEEIEAIIVAEKARKERNQVNLEF